MANKEQQGNQRMRRGAQGYTAGMQDPTQGYGLEKEPMDHPRPQGVPQNVRRGAEIDRDEDPHPGNQGATEPMKHARSEQPAFAGENRDRLDRMGAPERPEQQRGSQGQSRPGTGGQGSQSTGNQKQGSQRIGNQESRHIGNAGQGQTPGRRHESVGTSDSRGQDPSRKSDYRR